MNRVYCFGFSSPEGDAILENRRAKVELYEQIRREYEHGSERSERWPGSWGCTGEKCGRRWLARCRRNAKLRNGNGRSWRRRFHLLMRFWRPIARRPESSGM